jgi:hypothetical protein
MSCFPILPFSIWNRNFSISIGQTNYLPSNGVITSLFQAFGFLGRQQSALQALLYYNLRDISLTADEAKYQEEQAEGAGWIGE